ncbi:hypothetical protein ACQPZ2_07810 [Nocardia pseudovaccinii]|uniref:hypothetical protein n=1 Tax=Nocardia pseudovaccinii TaxID=189540 RepID=UPI003D948C02
MAQAVSPDLISPERVRHGVESLLSEDTARRAATALSDEIRQLPTAAMVAKELCQG